MNTTPDEDLLALWVEDELDATAHPAVDLWACSQPEWLEHRKLAREMKSLLGANLAAAEEPPYAEFFNARISREILSRPAEEPVTPVAPTVIGPGKMWRWFLPASAVAGMALCFWAGTRFVGSPQIVKAPESVPVPVLYTPEKGVKAAYFASEPADAMVIVLDGVAAIPDSFEVPDTASMRDTGEAATADIDSPIR